VGILKLGKGNYEYPKVLEGARFSLRSPKSEPLGDCMGLIKMPQGKDGTWVPEIAHETGNKRRQESSYQSDGKGGGEKRSEMPLDREKNRTLVNLNTQLQKTPMGAQLKKMTKRLIEDTCKRRPGDTCRRSQNKLPKTAEQKNVDAPEKREAERRKRLQNK